MFMISDTDAVKNFSDVLNKADIEGKVLIRRNDGSIFSLVPEKKSESPLNVEGISSTISTSEIVESVREARSRYE